MERKASAVWQGGLKDGKGEFSATSGVFSHVPYSFKTRFEDEPGQLGAVVVNGPSRFLGFLANHALTHESLTDWGGYKTGDLGYLDEDGFLYLDGRIDDVIVRGAENLSPGEIEDTIARHPSVREAAVVGRHALRHVSGVRNVKLVIDGSDRDVPLEPTDFPTLKSLSLGVVH